MNPLWYLVLAIPSGTVAGIWIVTEAYRRGFQAGRASSEDRWTRITSGGGGKHP